MNEVVPLRTAHLQFYDRAKQALAQAATVDEVKELRDKSIAMAMYAKQAKETELEIHAREIRLRAERRLGQMLAEMKKAGQLSKGGGDQKSNHRGSKDPSDLMTLESQGIDKNLAKRARALASITEASFEKRIDDIKGKIQAVPESMAEVRREFGLNAFEKEKKQEDINVVAGRQAQFFEEELDRERTEKLKSLVKFRKSMSQGSRENLSAALRKYGEFIIACADKLEE